MKNKTTDKLERKPLTIRVNVTREHIDYAENRNSSHCMVAEALRMSLSRRKIAPTWVAVDLQTIRFTNAASDSRYFYLTPRCVQKSIVRFDQGIKQEPFSFNLSHGQVLPMQRSSAKDKLYQKKLRDQKRKAKMSIKDIPGSRGRCLPDIEGGKPPPMAIGVRRQFGLKGLVP